MDGGSRPDWARGLLRPTLTREVGLILVLLAGVTLALIGAALFVAHPEGVRARDSFQSMRLYLWSAGAATFLLLGAGILLVRYRIAQPVRRVAAAARALAGGDLNRRLNEENLFGELGDLAAAFDSMAARVQGTVDNLASERDFTNALLEVFPEGVAIYGPGDDLTYANPAFRRLFSGESWREVFPCLKGDPCGLHRRVDILPPLVPKPIHLRVSCVMHAGRIFLTAEDETESVIARRRKAEWQDMLIHDVKSPLSAVLGTVKALMMDKRPEAELHLLGLADTAGNRVVKLLNTYLEVLRMESGARKVEAAPLDPGEACRAAAALCEPLARQADTAIVVGVQIGAVVRADPNLLERILSNLIDNAIKYGAPGREVRVLGGPRQDGGWLLKVADDGPGIPAEELPFIFHRFYRVSRRDGEGRKGGTGLGLAFCRLACELHGWRIRAESQAGKGTEMLIEIPAEAHDAAS